MQTPELSMAIEAILFAAAEPMGVTELRRILRRHLSVEEAPEDVPEAAAQDAADGAAQAQAPSSDSHDLAADVPQPQSPASADEADGAQAAAGESAIEAAAQVPAANLEAGVVEPEPDSIAPDAGTNAAACESSDDPSPEVLAAAWVEGDAPLAAATPFALAPVPPPASTRPKPLGQQIRDALAMLEARWAAAREGHGFALMQVAGGYTFRTRGRFARLLGAMSQERPTRLSRPALESLAIVAYRQPVTKPEVDALRGVDSGGTMKVLLERKLIATVGKKDEPGRPLLYGTTATFLSHYNLANLAALPSLREFNELNADSEDALRAFDGLPSLAELARTAPRLTHDDEPAVGALDEAVIRLRDTEGLTQQVLMAHGVSLQLGEEGSGSRDTGNPGAAVLH